LKQRRRRVRGRRGVSTVIANMMMIMITLSLAAVLVAWAGTSYGAFSGGTQLFFQQRGQALQERFVVENVFFNKTQNRALVFIRNVGLININVVAIYVNGTALTPTGSGSTCTFSGSPLSASLGVGSVCEFNMNWGSAWTTGATFLIVVASARGNQATFTARGP
jgi:FlaG/FlaF family flagellin (archaellin)